MVTEFSYAGMAFTHESEPESSYLVVAGTGAQQVLSDVEFARLDLENASLLVMSACNTGHELQTAYQGLTSLRTAATVAGARSVVMSLWKVDARATTALFREFYRQKLELKRPTGAALRAAQAAIGQRPEFRHPHYWAGWIAVGE